jgi:ribosomal protein S9
VKVVDLGRVRRALAKLDELEAEHPEVFDGRDERTWARALKGDQMGQTTSWQAAIRFPLELVGRIDAFREAVATVNPGVKVSRSDAVRMLVTRALDADRKATKKG